MERDIPPLRVALVGNPNCGKTALFNTMAAGKEPVGNYPRVTVAVKEKVIHIQDREVILADLPGIYSLTSRTPEEQVARDFLLEDSCDVIVNVLDANNLERSLFLTTQLLELGRPLVFALNMIDEAERRGVEIDAVAMSQMLRGPVVKTAGRVGLGVDALRESILHAAGREVAERSFIHFDRHVEGAVVRVQQLVADLHPTCKDASTCRWMAIKLLEGDDDILRREGEHDHLLELVRREGYDLSREHGQTCTTLFANARFGYVNGLMTEAVRRASPSEEQRQMTRILDAVFLNRILGIPLFIGLLWLMFHTTFTLGAYPMDWIDAGVQSLSAWVDPLLPPGMAHDLVVDGVIAGVGGTIIFLPNIVILFFFMALFSETGYLARAAFLMDRVMHLFGLHGKALIPMVMGFGCNVPAVMAARTIESHRARMITILVNPFMLCAARLPVFILFAGAFFAEHAGSVVFAMYMLSIVGAMLAAVALNRFFFSGSDEAFVMELPPYRLPTPRTVLVHMWDKGINFLQKIAGVILVGSIVIWFAQEFPRELNWSMDYDAAISRLQSEPESPQRDQEIRQLELRKKQEALSGSYLGQVAHAVAPVFQPIGFTWRDTVAILTGFVAKEVVVASYAVLYAQGEEADAESSDLRKALAASMTPLVAVAFMVFTLFYSPCLATIATIRQEAGGWKWAGFSVVFSLCLAWMLAFAVVKVGGLLL
ncbi:MAG: ferrous iron transport protein B [Magnetococcus sp. WYHC-3]